MLLRILLFWLVWLLAAPFVFLYLVIRKHSFAMSYQLTSLIRLSVWQKLVTRKPELRDKLLAEKRFKNFTRANSYTTKNRFN